MPIVEAHILAGYSQEEKSQLTRAMTNAIRRVVPVRDQDVTVTLHELPPEQGRRSRSAVPVDLDPKQIALDYLAALEAREIERAEALLAAGFQMTFPGTEPMARIADLIDWAKDRYRFVRKTMDIVDAFDVGDSAVVYITGTLSGEWPDGAPFEGIRFIDRFEIKDGKLIRQDVWNDIAEERAQ